MILLLLGCCFIVVAASLSSLLQIAVAVAADTAVLGAPAGVLLPLLLFFSFLLPFLLLLLFLQFVLPTSHYHQEGTVAIVVHILADCFVHCFSLVFLFNRRLHNWLNHGYVAASFLLLLLLLLLLRLLLLLLLPVLLLRFGSDSNCKRTLARL